MSRLTAIQPFGLPWPLPAVGAWGFAWILFICLTQLQWPSWLALCCAFAVPATVASLSSGWIRRGLVVGGFPLSAILAGQTELIPAWAWLLPLLMLLVIYPVRAWRDAPLFPTDGAALRGLAERVPLPIGAQVLDAGSGLGHGLMALQGQWPHAQIHGVESSAMLALISRLRCPFASVRLADMWAKSWTTYDVVYVFQRPESMPRAWQKARAQMRPGSWLVSLEFAVPDAVAHARLHRAGQRPLWIYQVPQTPTNSIAPAHNR